MKPEDLIRKYSEVLSDEDATQVSTELQNGNLIGAILKILTFVPKEKFDFTCVRLIETLQNILSSVGVAEGRKVLESNEFLEFGEKVLSRGEAEEILEAWAAFLLSANPLIGEGFDPKNFVSVVEKTLPFSEAENELVDASIRVAAITAMEFPEEISQNFSRSEVLERMLVRCATNTETWLLQNDSYVVHSKTNLLKKNVERFEDSLVFLAKISSLSNPDLKEIIVSLIKEKIVDVVLAPLRNQKSPISITSALFFAGLLLKSDSIEAREAIIEVYKSEEGMMEYLLLLFRSMDDCMVLNAAAFFLIIFEKNPISISDEDKAALFGRIEVLLILDPPLRLPTFLIVAKVLDKLLKESTYLSFSAVKLKSTLIEQLTILQISLLNESEAEEVAKSLRAAISNERFSSIPLNTPKMTYLSLIRGSSDGSSPLVSLDAFSSENEAQVFQFSRMIVSLKLLVQASIHVDESSIKRLFESIIGLKEKDRKFDPCNHLEISALNPDQLITKIFDANDSKKGYFLMNNGYEFALLADEGQGKAKVLFSVPFWGVSVKFKWPKDLVMNVGLSFDSLVEGEMKFKCESLSEFDKAKLKMKNLLQLLRLSEKKDVIGALTQLITDLS